MALPILVDGAALDATSFGELDDNGYWNPIEFTGVTTLDYINPAITAFIGNMTGNGGLSAISDGSRTYTANTALSANGVTANAFAGVDWGVGVTKTPMRIVVQNGLTTTVGPSWDGNNSGTINMAIYGSNSAPASYNDGTLLGSKTGITNTNNANLQEVFEGGDLTTTTGYRYHWVHLYASATEQVIGEVQFFAESATPGYGTNGFVLDFADSSHFGNDVSGAGVTPDLTVATSWSGTNLAQYGFSAGNITKNTLSQNAIRTVGVWGGDFSITLDLLDGDGTFGTNEQFFGFASASDTFDDTKTAPTITGTNYYIQPATDSATLMTYYRNGAAVSTFAVVPGDTIKWERSGTTVTLYVNTVSRFSETTSLTGLVYGFIQLYKTNESADNVTTTGTFSNSFIDSGFATTDQLADTPTDDVDLGIGNFFNFDPNATNAAVTLAEGNTKATFTGGTDYRANITGVTLPTSGKWYFEVEVTTLVSEVQIGVNLVANYATSGGNIGDSTGEIAYRSDGRKRESGSTTTFGATLPNGSLVGVAWDGDANKIWFAKTNSWQASGNPSAGTNPANSGTISTASYFAVKSYNSSVVNLNTGAKGFTYTPPTDFVALATQNLPAPTIADGSQYFNTVIYTGNGSTQAITGVGFQPDLVWIKARETVTSNGNHGVWDAVRGTSAAIRTNTSEAELGYGVTAFGADGFTVPSSTEVNENTKDYVAWCWKANGAGSSNTDGSITATVSANQTAGFSIVTTTFDATSAATIGHGLGVAPKFIMGKNRTAADDWACYHESIGASNRVQLNLTGASGASSSWNSTAPTTSVFSVNRASWVVSNPDDFVFYCWSEVEGFSKFGSYTGNGSADGPFVYTGFRPAFIMTKRTDSTSNWQMQDGVRDGYNGGNNNLAANSSNAEGATQLIDILSNGWKVRSTSTEVNASSGTYIYAAFAEHPFQGAEGYTQARAR
jgi:hypothetical protein